jgi:hypothetical protein
MQTEREHELALEQLGELEAAEDHDTFQARQEAAGALDDAARALKRTIGVCRQTLQTVRQVQAQVIGIQVETTEAPERSHSVNNSSTENHR